MNKLPAMFMVEVDGAGEGFDGYYLVDNVPAIADMLNRMAMDFDLKHTKVWVAEWREMDEEEYLERTDG